MIFGEDGALDESFEIFWRKGVSSASALWESCGGMSRSTKRAHVPGRLAGGTQSALERAAFFLFQSKQK